MAARKKKRAGKPKAAPRSPVRAKKSTRKKSAPKKSARKASARKPAAKGAKRRAAEDEEGVVHSDIRGTLSASFLKRLV